MNSQKELIAPKNVTTKTEKLKPKEQLPYSPKAMAEEMDKQLKTFALAYGLDLTKKDDMEEAREIIYKSYQYFGMVHALLNNKIHSENAK